MPITITQSLTNTLTDVDENLVAKLEIKVEVSHQGVSIYADGYGDHGSADGHGSPVFLELHEGRLRLLVWSDINEEDPTHCIYLDGAREDRRRPDNG